MIILDLSQVMISNLMMMPGLKNQEIDESLLRHMVLNSIRSINMKFKNEYGTNFVVACDERNSWRRGIFPYYKARRAENRNNSELNWDSIFPAMNNIRDELKEYFAYRVILVDGAEADDIIGTLSEHFSEKEKIMIISGDKDFIQLQRYPNVKQYSPVNKKMIETNDPMQFLKEHILRGDSGDGVPNFLSDDNCLVIKKRQTPLSAKKIAQWDVNTSNDTILKRNYYRNEQLIDLTKTPDHIKLEIINKYNEQEGKTRAKMFNYFMSKKLKNLMELINDF